MAEANVAVLQEKVFYVERELQDLKRDIREQGQELEGLVTAKETTLLKLEQIQKQLASIDGTLKSDSGWRGFFIDFIKAAAQIAALVAAGHWIFFK